MLANYNRIVNVSMPTCIVCRLLATILIPRFLHFSIVGPAQCGKHAQVQGAIQRSKELGDGEAEGVGEFFAVNEVRKCPWGAMLSIETFDLPCLPATMGQCRGRKEAQERCDLADVGPVNDVHGRTNVAGARKAGATPGFEAEGL